MKAYFINLDRSPERREHMEAALRDLGIAFERIAAVDARDLTDAEIDRHYRPLPGADPVDRGSIACFLSHRLAWRRIAESAEPFGLVLEDDILFGEDAGAILSDTSWIPEDTETVRLETFRRHTVYEKRPVARVAGRDIVRMRHVHLGGGAYILSRAAATRLLEKTDQFSFAVDYVLFNPQCPQYSGMDTLQIVPALCIQSTMAPESARNALFPSLLQDTRRTVFSTGLKRLGEKLARELAKRRLIITGRLFDRLRGQKTGRIPFR